MRRERSMNETGFALVELAVAMALLGVLIGVITTTVAGSKRSADTVRQVNGLNEEARLALNRITRELRQASAITAVGAPDGATSMTIGVDFNGSGGIDPSTADPEELTYRWDGDRILLSAADTTGTVVTSPILSGEVSALRFDYRSSRYEFDCDGDGVTAWQELDADGCGGAAGATIGNGNGVLDHAELPHVDSVVLTFRVLDGSRKQDYRTQVDLRNAP